ncbi:hypothetical protein NP570_24875, partial [Vibrio parahaemolyticus]|nr:hypothetical protein [Vibrio parahaemolyticus]
ISKSKPNQAAAEKLAATDPDNSQMAKLREERKRLARELKAEKEQSETPANNADYKKSSVAAAIALAKAKKAQQEENAS